MKTRVAWRILSHQAGRTTLAAAGTYVAILMIFLQLGFYASVPKGGMTIYRAMRYDLMLASSAYIFQGQPLDFPRRRLYEALALPEVAAASPVYQASSEWLNPEDGLKRDVFVIGVRPEDEAFADPEIEAQRGLLRRPDTILVDRDSRQTFGPLLPGRRVEIADRALEIGGTYGVGIGFVGLGVVVTSDQNFLRLFPERSLGAANLGLLTLRPGADPDAVAARLRRILPDDTQVFTRQELTTHEVAHWLERTSTGLVFGFGVIVATIVGGVILYQTLASQVARELPQYATLKAIGYRSRDLADIVVRLGLIVLSAGFLPAVISATIVYAIVRAMTRLPIEMTLGRVLSVGGLCLGMAVVATVLSLRVVHRADPVELF
jgi:putative ABC transport system permease protein